MSKEDLYNAFMAQMLAEFEKKHLNKAKESSEGDTGSSSRNNDWDKADGDKQRESRWNETSTSNMAETTNAQSSENRSVKDEILLPQKELMHINLAGVIIGPKGSNIKKWRQETNCWFSIVGVNPIVRMNAINPNTEGPLRVEITAQNAENLAKGKKKIEDFLNLCWVNPDEVKKMREDQFKVLNEMQSHGGMDITTHCAECGSEKHLSWKGGESVEENLKKLTSKAEEMIKAADALIANIPDFSGFSDAMTTDRVGNALRLKLRQILPKMVDVMTGGRLIKELAGTVKALVCDPEEVKKFQSTVESTNNHATPQAQPPAIQRPPFGGPGFGPGFMGPSPGFMGPPPQLFRPNMNMPPQQVAYPMAAPHVPPPQVIQPRVLPPFSPLTPSGGVRGPMGGMGSAPMTIPPPGVQNVPPKPTFPSVVAPVPPPSTSTSFFAKTSVEPKEKAQVQPSPSKPEKPPTPSDPLSGLAGLDDKKLELIHSMVKMLSDRNMHDELVNILESKKSSSPDQSKKRVSWDSSRDRGRDSGSSKTASGSGSKRHRESSPVVPPAPSFRKLVSPPPLTGSHWDRDDSWEEDREAKGKRRSSPKASRRDRSPDRRGSPRRRRSRSPVYERSRQGAPAALPRSRWDSPEGSVELVDVSPPRRDNRRR